MKRSLKAILNSALAVVLAVGLCPGFAFAQEEAPAEQAVAQEAPAVVEDQLSQDEQVAPAQAEESPVVIEAEASEDPEHEVLAGVTYVEKPLELDVSRYVTLYGDFSSYGFRFTAPSDGTYVFYSYGFVGGSRSGGRASAALYNGHTTDGTKFPSEATVSSSLDKDFMIVVQLTANQEVCLNAGSTLNGGSYNVVVSQYPCALKGSVESDISWSLDADGTMTIQGNGSLKPGYDHAKRWNFAKNLIKRVEIGSGVGTIDSSMFSDCPNLSYVELPSTASFYSNSNPFVGVADDCVVSVANRWCASNLEKAGFDPEHIVTRGMAPEPSNGDLIRVNTSSEVTVNDKAVIFNKEPSTWLAFEIYNKSDRVVSIDTLNFETMADVPMSVEWADPKVVELGPRESTRLIMRLDVSEGVSKEGTPLELGSMEYGVLLTESHGWWAGIVGDTVELVEKSFDNGVCTVTGGSFTTDLYRLDVQCDPGLACEINNRDTLFDADGNAYISNNAVWISFDEGEELGKVELVPAEAGTIEVGTDSAYVRLTAPATLRVHSANQPEPKKISVKKNMTATTFNTNGTSTSDVKTDVRDCLGGFCEMVRTSTGIDPTRFPVVGNLTAFKVGTNTGYSLKAFNVTYTDKDGVQQKLTYNKDKFNGLSRVGNYSAAGTVYEFTVPDANDVAINITWERTVAEIHKTLTTDTQVVKDVRNGNGGFCEMVKTSDGIAASKYPVVGKRTAFKVGTNSGYTLKSFNVTYTDESGKQVKLTYTKDGKGGLTRVGEYKATGTTYEFDVPNAKDISVNVTWAKK